MDQTPVRKQQDTDSQETAEWLSALDDVLQAHGSNRAVYLMEQLNRRLLEVSGQLSGTLTTPYRNTIPPAREARMPGDLFMDRKIRSIIRWNALAMVSRANLNHDELGGHISSFSSSATLYDVGFNYFFRAPTDTFAGDLIYFQGHSAPGIYARAYLEGRLDEAQLDHFRREVDGNGLSSYPHPWLMPDFWQFPTVSMGLGSIQAIYQAHFMKYMDARGLVPMQDRKVWTFLGDGECDEPESLGAISLAGREQLDNLIFVVNCNLQRLDGPVRGNGKIIQELEGAFRGAGWNVIKVVWGRLWDPLFEQDKSGLLQQRMDEVVDGEYQNCKAHGGAYTREHFFGAHAELLDLVKDLSDDDIMRLNRGGHDPYKVYAAYHEARHHQGQPTVVLAKTVKGYGLGGAVESGNTTHSVKKLSKASLQKFRDRFDIPLNDEQIKTIPYYRPPEDAPEVRYMKKRREALGGYLPQRCSATEALQIPSLADFAEQQFQGSGKRQISSTMCFVRLLSRLVRDKQIGARIVPIVPDEARTFGMEGMFKQLGIYSSVGQLYAPVDSDQITAYRESREGQVLEEGITEAGAFSAWLAAATSYSTNGYSMIPFYVFYSMFGFQRVGDLSWLAGDSQARGFLIGATSGRTTLNGEGLQHQDGHSHILAGTIPNCVAYDPAYGYELAVIMHHGLQQMYVERKNQFFYITLTNENIQQPPRPEGDDAIESGIIKGIYCLERDFAETPPPKALHLLGSGAILREVREAAQLLRDDYGCAVNVWSVTSFNALAVEAAQCARWNLMHPDASPKTSYIAAQFGDDGVPLVAATDYMKAHVNQIQPYIPSSLLSLGTDGFGRSDTRARLRAFFEVDRHYVTLGGLYQLAAKQVISSAEVRAAQKKFGIDPDKPDPREV